MAPPARSRVKSDTFHWKLRIDLFDTYVAGAQLEGVVEAVRSGSGVSAG